MGVVYPIAGWVSAQMLNPPPGSRGEQAAGPQSDQPTIDFDPVRITTSTADGLTLREAFALIGRETGSGIEFLGPAADAVHLEARRSVEFKDKTFWEAYDLIRDHWGMHVNAMGGRDGKLTVNYGAPTSDSWNPFGAGSLATPYGSTYLAPAANHGAFKVMLERGPDQLLVYVYPEPRLMYCQPEKAQLIVAGANGKRVTLPPLAGSQASWVFFSFDASKAPESIVAVSFQASMTYPYDWQAVDLGDLKSAAAKKRLKAGLLQFQIKEALRIQEEGPPSLRLAVLLQSKAVCSAADFQVFVSAESASLEQQSPTRVAGQGGSLELKYELGEVESIGSLLLRVRAPQKVKEHRVKYAATLP